MVSLNVATALKWLTLLSGLCLTKWEMSRWILRITVQGTALHLCSCECLAIWLSVYFFLKRYFERWLCGKVWTINIILAVDALWTASVFVNMVQFKDRQIFQTQSRIKWIASIFKELQSPNFYSRRCKSCLFMVVNFALNYYLHGILWSQHTICAWWLLVVCGCVCA